MLKHLLESFRFIFVSHFTSFRNLWLLEKTGTCSCIFSSLNYFWLYTRFHSALLQPYVLYFMVDYTSENRTDEVICCFSNFVTLKRWNVWKVWKLFYYSYSCLICCILLSKLNTRRLSDSYIGQTIFLTYVTVEFIFIAHNKDSTLVRKYFQQRLFHSIWYNLAGAVWTAPTWNTSCQRCCSEH